MITIGSCFSGIGGFELGLESAIPNSKTIWQIEQDEFCQQILKKHWPHAHIHGDIKNATEQNLERPDLLVAGFPCQDISIAGKGEGIIKGSRSSLFFDMWRLCLQLRPSIVILENVPALYSRGLGEVLRTVAESGIYDCEWGYLEAQYFGAPHKRRRIFIVCYLADTKSIQRHGRKHNKHKKQTNRQRSVEVRRNNSAIITDTDNTGRRENARGTLSSRKGEEKNESKVRRTSQKPFHSTPRAQRDITSDTDNTGRKEQRQPQPVQEKQSAAECGGSSATDTDSERNVSEQRPRTQTRGRARDCTEEIWAEWTQESPLIAKVRGVDDGISSGLDRDRRKRLKALGNAIVPQCSAWIGQRLILTGKLEGLR